MFVLTTVIIMSTMAKATPSEQAERKYLATYISVEHREILNQMLENIGVNRYEYFKGLVLHDMVRRGLLSPMEVRRKDRHLLEMFS